MWGPQRPTSAARLTVRPARLPHGLSFAPDVERRADRLSALIMLVAAA